MFSIGQEVRLKKDGKIYKIIEETCNNGHSSFYKIKSIDGTNLVLDNVNEIDLEEV
jgi:hypothetical protein